MIPDKNKIKPQNTPREEGKTEDSLHQIKQSAVEADIKRAKSKEDEKDSKNVRDQAKVPPLQLNEVQRNKPDDQIIDQKL